jgi:transposase
MIVVTGNQRIFLYRGALDLRKGFEGLSAVIEMTFNEKPLSGGFYVFINRRRDRMKVLYWDGDGLAIWYKRLEQGTFSKRGTDKILLDRREFFMLLEGITPKRMQKRFQLS